MGKRKERRLAALSNAGRRVKLDLFAEPSGDLGGSSVHDEVGGDIDSKHRAELPNSPSSSGQQPQNPLLLLGQYSDDELDEESNERINHAIVENSSVDHKDQVKGSLDEGYEDMDVKAEEALPAQVVKLQDIERDSTSPDAFQKLDGSDTRESDVVASCDVRKEINSAEQIAVSGTSDIQVIGDISSGWKIVMHEESNQYYYWNTETGETSWEVPDILAQTTGMGCDQKTTPVIEETERLPVGVDESDATLGVELDGFSAALDGSLGTNMVAQSKEVYDQGPQNYEGIEGYKYGVLKDPKFGIDVSQSELRSSSGAVNAPMVDVGSTVAGSEKGIHDSLANEEHKRGIDLPSHLVEQSECLLERLKSLKGSNSHVQGHDWMAKYIFEVEIRLSDIKSLQSCGSSLLPFWMHSERQLKRLEGAINDEIHQPAKAAHMDEVQAVPFSIYGEKEKLKEALGHDLKSVFPSHENFQGSPNVDTLTAVEKDSHSEVPYKNVVNAEHISHSGSPTSHLESGAAVDGHVNGSAILGESISQPGFHAGEDVDMDVDMEVEDVVPVGSTVVRNEPSAQSFTPLEQLVQSNPPAEYPLLAPENGFTVPPPPDEEWIPPPPPDNELIPPPPPPDEPPEPTCPPPPSYTEIEQPLSYTQQYNFTYSDSNFEYYANTGIEVPGSNFYGHADGSQVVMPHAPLYYEAVPNTYAETVPVVVNPVQPVAYYDIQSVVPSIPVDNTPESSQFNGESGTLHYGTLASEQIGSVDALAEAGPEVKIDDAVGGGAEMSSTEVLSTSATIQAPATISVKESATAPLTNAVAGPTAAVKAQSKVLRTKKRTVAVAPSLRSNKKVSSLVDKWKAAKEELHEDEEDEPQDPLEILEKKRQREIQEWRAQQIASGEAKDNANFQPLGGDWRERVKRRRAQLAAETAQKPAEVVTNKNQQPDLVELSRDLPSGWQAFWDESSKQVYYGNADTSESTWTRPTK